MVVDFVSNTQDDIVVEYQRTASIDPTLSVTSNSQY